MKKGAKRQERLDNRRGDYDKMVKGSTSDIYKKVGQGGFKRPGSMAK